MNLLWKNYDNEYWKIYKMKKNHIKICLLFVCFLMICVLSCKEKSKLEQKELIITKSNGEEVSVLAEIARTEEERSFGYMEREHIPQGTGMFFIFDRDQILSFWMKNTPTPLSIAYIDSKGVIRDIFDMKPFSLTSIVSTKSVRYALEVPQGWFSEQGIVVGDIIKLPN